MLGEKPITLRRVTGPGTISDTTGKYTPPTRTSSSIMASVQPGGGRTTRTDGENTVIAPDGHRRQPLRRIFTRTEIRTADQVGLSDADYLTFDGATWVAMRTSGHAPVGMNLGHYEVTCQRLAEGHGL